MWKSPEERKAVVERLIALEEKGVLRPDAVVEDARDPASPLHSHFQWDDSKAAHAFRLEQARRLIRIRYSWKTTRHQYKTIKYVQNPSNYGTKTQGYVRLDKLAANPDAARAHLIQEFTMVRARLERAREHARELDMLAAVDGLIAEVVRVQVTLTTKKAPPGTRPS